MAQVKHLGRYEIPLSYEIRDLHVVPNGEGFLIVTEEKAPDDEASTAKFKYLNDDFDVVWIDTIPFANRFYVEALDYLEGKNYVLMNDRTGNGFLNILEVDPQEKTVNRYEQQLFRNIKITDFIAIQNSVVIAGEIENKPAVFLYDLKAKKLNTLNNIFQFKGELLEVKRNNDRLSFNVLVSQLDEKNDWTVVVNTYDYQGSFLRNYQLVTEPFYQLTNGVSSSINEIEQVVVGLYHYKKGTDPSGYYVNHVGRSGKQTMKYLPFGAFISFFEHEGEEKAKRLRERSLDKTDDQKPFRYNVDAIINPILERDEKLIVNTQFFKPVKYIDPNSVMAKEGQIARSTWKPAGLREFVKTYTLEFTHSFTFEINLKGNLIWDLNTEINTSQSGGLQDFGEFSDDMSNLMFGHYYNEKLFIHDLRKSKTYYDISLPLLLENDVLKFENASFGGIKSWKNNRYLIYGIQHIADKNNPERLRKVYFVNGIAASSTSRASRID